jgi:hypothetical protein
MNGDRILLVEEEVNSGPKLPSGRLDLRDRERGGVHPLRGAHS